MCISVLAMEGRIFLSSPVVIASDLQLIVGIPFMVHISPSSVMDLKHDRTPFDLPVGIYFGLSSRLSWIFFILPIR